jgi:sulfoxide reductase heme-binding subunit YedZ
MHTTGEFSARLHIIALAITPLRAMFSRAAWLKWLAKRRRYLGVAAFGYAMLHMVLYSARASGIHGIALQALEASMWTGWLALAIMLPLALTSNDWSVQRLRQKWRTLHRLVYAAALLTFFHWILAAFNPVAGFVHFAVLAGLECLRLWSSSATKRN